MVVEMNKICHKVDVPGLKKSKRLNKDIDKYPGWQVAAGGKVKKVGILYAEQNSHF
jgi:hypothetical protein